MQNWMIKDLPHGVYQIFFEDSKQPCLASVGSTSDGTRWYAPCNWTSDSKKSPLVASTDWSQIQRVELIETHDYVAAED